MRIQKLTLENFRGIPKLSTDIGRSNFAIFGRNGSGKSGVVDAIEFALTGQISRLSGAGTKGISLKNQAPHVDCRERPEDSWVEIDVSTDSQSQIITIKRSPNEPKNPTVTPDTPESRAVLERIEKHSEFVLSRKEILKYVLAEPGKRSQEVQALLDLREADDLRKIFVGAKTDANRAVTSAEGELSRAKPPLCQLLNVKELSAQTILEAVNTQRKLAGVSEITVLNQDAFNLQVDDKDKKKEEVDDKKLTRKQAEKVLDDFLKLKQVPSLPEELKKDHITLSDVCSKLLDDTSLMKSYKRLDFLSSGLELIDDESCPFCETAWDIEALKEQVAARINAAQKAKELAGKKQNSVKSFETFLSDVKHKIKALSEIFEGNEDPTVQAHKLSLGNWLSEVDNNIELLKDDEKLKQLKEYLQGALVTVPETFAAIEQAAFSIVEKIPSVDTKQEAISCLNKAGERYHVYVTADEILDKRRKVLVQATELETLFNNALEESLEAIYSEVEGDFSRYYRLLNQDDESDFSGEFKPIKGGLNLAVDFYGRGKFPPIAYHSEGHQDSMGICLHLALMKRVLGSEYTLSVLDDVLMSIDSGHRRQFLSLLKQEFPGTQFVLTTHDQVWFRQMHADGFIENGKSLHFKDWDVETGPVIGDPIPLLKKARKQLEDDDVNGAAHSLRFGLELAGAEIAERIRPRVPYSSTASWDLGDIWPNVLKAFESSIKEGKTSATSWGKKDKEKELQDFQDSFNELRKNCKAEEWSVNPNVHYNQWANFQKEDFLPVLESFEKLLDLMRCKDCSGWLFLSPLKGTPESLRCLCNGTNVNLLKKKKDQS